MGTSKNSFSMKSTAVLRHSSSFKVLKSIQAEHRDSKLVWDHDRGAEVDAEGINTTSIHHFSFLLHSFHKGIYEGSLSLRAKAQVFVFLA